MTVQELIEELKNIEDKNMTVRIRIGEGDYGTELAWEINVKNLPTPIKPYNETFLVIS